MLRYRQGIHPLYSQDSFFLLVAIQLSEQMLKGLGWIFVTQNSHLTNPWSKLNKLVLIQSVRWHG